MRLTSILARVSTAVLLVAFSYVPLAAGADPVPAASNATVDLSRLRIGNFGRVNDTYYRGEQPLGRDYTDLAALGVRTVLDLQADGDNQDEEQLVEQVGMKFRRIPMTTHVPPTPDQIQLFLDIVNDRAQQPVYVHCAGGRHRTGVMTAVYRMSHDGWTSDQAFNEMKQYKFGADFLHAEFKRFVYDYHATPAAEAPPQVLAVATKTQ